MDWIDEEIQRRAAGQRRALYPSQHDAINARHFPGTRQLCEECDQPTGRCEDDSLYHEDHGPLCEACWMEYETTPTAEGEK